MAKHRLVEDYARDWNGNVLPLNRFAVKENKIVEAEGENHNVNHGYEVPVWRLDEKNLNGRIYPTELAEKLVKESPKTFNLKDHPDDEGSIDHIVGVSENPHIKEGILYVDAYIVDENFENKLEKILERGMGLGVSSSAYGDVDENGRVLTEDFEIERFFDFVLNPSYQVYLTKEAKKEEQKETFDESLTNNSEEESQQLNEEEQKEGEESKKEKHMADTDKKKESMEEKNLKLGVKQLFKTAEATEDLREQRGIYEEVLDYCKDVESDFAQEYVEEAQNKINEIDEKLFELADKGKEVDSLKENTEKEKNDLQKSIEEKDQKIEDLEAKLDKAYQMLDDMKLREQKINEMYNVAIAEKNGMVTAAEYNELYKYYEKQEERLQEMKKENRKLKKKMERFSKDKDEDEETPTRRARPSHNRKEEVKEEEPKKEEVGEKEELEEEELDESQFDSPNFDEIKEWYETQVASYPRMKEFKEEFLSCRTLFEAQMKYLKYKDLIEETPSPYKSNYYNLHEENGKKKENKKQYYNTVKIRDGWL